MGTKAYSIRKKVHPHHTSHNTKIRLIPDRGILGEGMQKVVEEAETLSALSQDVAEISKHPQRPTLLSPRSYHAKLPSKFADHRRVGKPQRRLLPASAPSTLFPTRERPLLQAPEGQKQLSQSASSCYCSRNDHYST